MEQKKKNTNIIVGVDEKISWSKALLLGMQHVLAMDLYIAPIIIAGLLALDTMNTTFSFKCVSLLRDLQHSFRLLVGFGYQSFKVPLMFRLVL